MREPPTEAVPAVWRQRSDGSLAFEAFWRSLPKSGLVPSRETFVLENAEQFRQNVILVEAPSPERRSLNFRMAGDIVGERTGRDVQGTNYLDYLPAEQHAESLEAARLVSEHPCGIWQLTPISYERGFSQFIEVTTFPLGPGADGVPLLVGFLAFHYGTSDYLVMPTDRAVSAETSRIFEFIDIGAGIPTLKV